jgi:hypothetical protein
MPDLERENDLLEYLLSDPMAMMEFMSGHEQDMRSPLNRAWWRAYRWLFFFKTLLWGEE